MVTITIKTDNAAFSEIPGSEIARILRELADDLEGYEHTDFEMPLRDINGNIVGHCRS